MPIATMERKDRSISTSAKLHIVNDSTSLVTDSVSLSFELFVRLFPNTQQHGAEQEDRFVLIKFIGVPDYFNKFNIYKVTSIDDHAPTSASVTITNHSNLVQFGNNLTISGCVVQSIDTGSIPVLEKIFVEVPPAIYDIMHNSPVDSVKEQFISKYIAGNGGVVAQKDSIAAINGTVRLCEPYFQGFVRSSTSIVFIKGEAETDTLALNLLETDEVDLDLSMYLSRSMHMDLEKVQNDYKLLVSPLPQRISVGLIPTLFTQEDPELYAFIGTDDLSKLGFPIFNGDLATLDTGSSKTTVKVFTFLEPNKSFREGTIYLSPLLLVNLHLHEKSTVTLKPSTTKSQLFIDAFPIAKTATIARVASPITMDRTFQQSFFAELKATFALRVKCVRQGDFIPVCIDSVLAKALFEIAAQNQQGEDEPVHETTVPSGNPDSVAWFKVIEITGGENLGPDQQFKIDPSQTALTSSGVEFTRTPSNNFNCWAEYLQLPPIFNFSKAIEEAPSQFAYAKELNRIIRTTVNTNAKVDLKTTVLLNSMSRGLGKTTVVRSLALEMGLNLIELDAFDFIKPGAELKTIGLLTGRIEKQLNGQNEAASCNNYNILYIKHIENLCVQTDQNEQGANTSTSLSLKVVHTIQDFLSKYKNMALIASCNDIDKLSDSFRQIIKFQIDVTVPSEQERLEIFRFLLDKETRASNNEIIPEAFEDKVEFTGRLDFSRLLFDRREDVSCQTLALQSAGLTPRDLISIVRKAEQLAVKRLMGLASKAGVPLEKLIKIANGGLVVLIPEDFEKAINEARSQFSDSIGAPRIPNVKWEDIGGLDLVKDEIMDTIDMPLKHPELFSNGLKKRSGILFYGPPGTGKTLLAKAIATNFLLNFFSVKGPELLNMYIGESEANVRRVFQRARDAKPCVIFFDELDSVAPKRGNQGDSGGVMDRIVSQLLAELDGMSGGESNGDGVFVVGATNRPDLLDEALLRPGRFDKMLYLGISDTDDKQAKILEALTRKFKLSDEVDLLQIAEKCSFTFTGADFYALCSDSMLNAMTRTANEVDAKLKKLNQERVKQGKEEVSSRWWFDNAATPEDINVLVTMEDFHKAQSELVPSVSADELAHYLRVKQNFEGGKEKAKKVEEVPEHQPIDYENGIIISENGH